MDQTRKYDLEELWKMRRGAVGSKKDWVDEKISRIMREDGFTQEMRQRLVRAIRANDVAAIKHFSLLIKRHNGEMLDATNT